MNYFFRSLQYLRPYWKLAVISVTLMFLTIITGLLEPWPLKVLFDNVLGPHPLPPYAQRMIDSLGLGRTGLLVLAVGIGLFIVLLNNAFGVWDAYVNTKIRLLISLDFRSEIFQHVQRLSLTFHDQSRAGMVIYIINYQADAAAALLMAAPLLAQSVFTIIGMFWIIYVMQPTLAMLTLVVVPVLYYSVHYYVKHIQTRLLHVKMLEAESLAVVHESISMLRVIVAFGREMFQYRKFREQGEIATDERVKLTVRQQAFTMVVNLTTATGTAIVMGVGAYYAMNRQITPGQLLVIMAYVASVYKPLETISTTIGGLQDQIVSLKIFFDLLDQAPEIQDAPDAVEIGRAKGHIAFENINFSYSGREHTLSDISFEAEAGQVVALVGPTGAGKTTMISLIPRFYEAQEGRVLLDGTDIREIKLKSLRDQVSMVLQEPLLFSGTIMENIRYGRLEAIDEEIVEAAKSANAHDFISNLPEGYGTVIGERGSQLSGGERQRVSVARAFLRDAPILILDEPTSAIDSKTESVILEALERLMVGRTTFMVAHRLSTIRNADRILVMNGGELVEQGTHEELLKNEGLYSQLYEMQTQRSRKKIMPMNPAHEIHENGADGNGANGHVEQETASVATLDAPRPVAARTPRPARLFTPTEFRPMTPSPSSKKIVVLGMMSKHPVAGVIWQNLHYLLGFERLGYEAYYVESGAYMPSSVLADPEDHTRSRAAADFLDRTLSRYDLGGRWAFHALHDDGKCYGMTTSELRHLYKDAALIVNLHGATIPLPEHYETGRLIYLETDPVAVQVEVHQGMQETIDYLKPHSAFFTFGENYGSEDCGLPFTEEFEFLPTRQPVVMDFWKNGGEVSRPYTTIGNWFQAGREVTLDGELYQWSKNYEFSKFLDLPARTGQEFELSLSHCDDEDQRMLRDHGWMVRDALSFSYDVDQYWEYIASSKGEFTVAKDQNIRLRSGWFSDRSATYLAAGRPVITQDTGFGNVLPTGEGLFDFNTVEEAQEAVERIEADYEHHSNAAYEVANEHFNSDVVLRQLLDVVDV